MSLQEIYSYFGIPKLKNSFGEELKLIPYFYSHLFWESHHMRDSEIVISMVRKSVQCGRYQRLEGPGS